MALGDYGEAVASLQSAIRLTPFVRPSDLLNLADCMRKIGHDRAAAEFELLAHEKP